MAVLPATKKAWRYIVTEVGGDVPENVKVGGHIVDWYNLGQEYTWNVVQLGSFEITGWWTGKLVDKGMIVDGKYVPI